MVIFINRYFLSWAAVMSLLLFIVGGGSVQRGANSPVYWPILVIVTVAEIIWWRSNVNRRKAAANVAFEQEVKSARKAASSGEGSASEH